MNLVRYIEKIKKKVFGATSDDILRDLEQGGARIGKGVIIFDPRNTLIDGTRPWLIEIGNYTKITRGCIILTHDYSLSVLRRYYGEWIGEGEKTIMGENVFLGVNTVVLMGPTLEIM